MGVVIALPLTIRAEDAITVHTQWDDLLLKYVAEGSVDYKGFKADEKALDAYLALLNKTNPSTFTRKEKLAFWINAYNAFTVKLILEHYPIRSIRDIKKPWKTESWKVTGQKVSLNHIEHNILRKELKESRIHFAIVCASVGCPDLWNHAYSGKNIEKELDAATTGFMRSNKHVRTEIVKKSFGRKTRILWLSSIFDWFGSDFKKNGQTLQHFTSKYGKKDTANFISDTKGKIKVRFLKYDWNLNGK